MGIFGLAKRGFGMLKKTRKHTKEGAFLERRRKLRDKKIDKLDSKFKKRREVFRAAVKKNRKLSDFEKKIKKSDALYKKEMKKLEAKENLANLAAGALGGIGVATVGHGMYKKKKKKKKK